MSVRAMFGRKRKTLVSIADMLSYGAAFKAEPRLALSVLHEELCVRCCHQAISFRDLGRNIDSNGIENLAVMYEQQFSDLRKWSLRDDAESLTRTLASLQARQSKVMEVLMDAVAANSDDPNAVLPQLDHCVCSYISLSSMVGHHLALASGGGQADDSDSGRVGMVWVDAPIVQACVEDCVEEVSTLCDRYIGTGIGSMQLGLELDPAHDEDLDIMDMEWLEVPRVRIEGDVSATATCVPAHLRHCVLELLKNAVRATVEHQVRTHLGAHMEERARARARGGSGNSDRDSISSIPPMPEVRVLVSQGGAAEGGEESAQIMVIDEGGGMGRRRRARAFDYVYSTAVAPQKVMTYAAGTVQNDPLTGLGTGLPVSRAYLRMFGGDLELLSLEGKGTGALVSLPQTHAAEKLRETSTATPQVPSSWV